MGKQSSASTEWDEKWTEMHPGLFQLPVVTWNLQPFSYFLCFPFGSDRKQAFIKFLKDWYQHKAPSLLFQFVHVCQARSNAPPPVGTSASDNKSPLPVKPFKIKRNIQLLIMFNANGFNHMFHDIELFPPHQKFSACNIGLHSSSNNF